MYNSKRGHYKQVGNMVGNPLTTYHGWKLPTLGSYSPSRGKIIT